MPLCPQITNTPITVSLTADYTVTNVVPVLPATTEQLAALDVEVAAAVADANAAAADAAAAQATATTALANAATAYTTAQNSLQPSAYAIQNPTTKQLTAIDATGLTVWSGGSATSGARVVLNSTGLAGFNSSGVATFSVSASTGDAVFKGNIAGASIIGSDLNISGNCIIKPDGTLIAMAATIKGEINATSGYFGSSSTQGWSISGTNLVGVGSGTIITSTGNNRIVMGSSNNALSFYYNGNPLTHMVATTGGAGVWLHYGASPSPTTRAYPLVNVSSSDASIEGSSTYQIVSSSTGNVIYGAANFTSNLTVAGSITGGNSTNGLFEFLSSSGRVRVEKTYTGTSGGSVMYVTSAGLFGVASSTERKKKDIESYQINEDALLSLDVKTFRYKDELDDDQFRQFGLIAEDADALGLFELVGYDENGLPDRIAYDRISTFLIPIIRKLKAEIDQLKGA